MLWNETFCRELVTYDFSLVVLHTISIFSLWCMLGGNVRIYTKSSLLQYIEDQTHFNTSWHAKMSLTFNYVECSLFKPPHNLSKHAPQVVVMHVFRTWKVLCAKWPTPDLKITVSSVEAIHVQKCWRIRMEIGKLSPRQTTFDLDMCLTLGSLVFNCNPRRTSLVRLDGSPCPPLTH